jgi:RNA polymerase sigma-70 factor (ECF subfamily)
LEELTNNLGKPNNTELINELLDYSDKVYRICLGFCRNPWDAEELMQEVYLRAIKKLGSLKNLDRKREWIFRIARNACLNHCKRERFNRMLLARMPDHSVNHNSPEWRMIQSEEFRIFKHSIRKLQYKLREVFILREYGCLSYSEIADLLGIKEGTVRSRLNRARRSVLARTQGVEHD